MFEQRQQRSAQRSRAAAAPGGGRWAFRLLMALLLIAGVVFVTSFVLRSEWFLRGRVDPRLESLGQRLGGTFSYEGIHPIGLTGVALEGLVFTPAPELKLPSPLHVAKISVFPDLGAMLTGRLEPRRIELEGVDVEFWLDGSTGGRGHWAWLQLVVENWEGREKKRNTGGGGGGEVRDSSFPEIAFKTGRVKLVSPEGTLPDFGLRVDDLLLHRSKLGRLQLDGAIQVDGLGYALLAGGADHRRKEAEVVVKLTDKNNLLDLSDETASLRRYIGPDSRLELSGVEMQWPPALVLHGVRLTDTRIMIPGYDHAHIEELKSGKIRVGFNEREVFIRFDDFSSLLRVGWIDAFATSIPLRLPSLDVGLDFDQRRFGFGFEIDHPEQGGLRLQAALDIDALDFGVEVDARHFNAGPLLSFVPYTGPINVTEGRIDGNLKVRYPVRSELVDAEVAMGFEGVALTVPWIASAPMSNLNVRFDGKVRVDLLEEALKIDESVVTLGTLPMKLSGDITRVKGSRHVDFGLHLNGDALPADELLSSLPLGFAPALEGYDLRGLFSLDFDLALDTRDVATLVFEPSLDIAKVEVAKHGPKADIPLLGKDRFALRVNTATTRHVIGPQQDNWTPLRRVPKMLQNALISAEDGKFFRHEGFDFRAIRRSLVKNLEERRVVRGGSTITQQLAKNLFLSQRKTVSRKLQEAFLTWQLEEHLSKKRILELYFNMVHWGRDVYGVEAAAKHYFKKTPRQLSLRESIFLVSILPNPVRFGEQYADGFIQSDRLYKMRAVLRGLYRRGIVNESTYETSLKHLRRAQISSRPRPALPSQVEETSEGSTPAAVQQTKAPQALTATMRSCAGSIAAGCGVSGVASMGGMGGARPCRRRRGARGGRTRSRTRCLRLCRCTRGRSSRRPRPALRRRRPSEWRRRCRGCWRRPGW